VLRTADVGAPDPSQVPDTQTPLAGTAHVSPIRAADPGGSYPWAIRVATSKTGFTCTTVGQVHDGVFALVGLDHIFRRLPGELSDACGQGVLTGVRIVAGASAAGVRSIVYGAAGAALTRATLITDKRRRDLRVGPGGTFVAALRGYPEAHATAVELRFAGGRTQLHNFGSGADNRPDPGGVAFTSDVLELGTRQRCARVRTQRIYGDKASVTPTACLGLRTTARAWVADARRLTDGSHGVLGEFDGWAWRSPDRTIVWGTGRTAKTQAEVDVLGDGAPIKATLSPAGAFFAVLPAKVPPASLTLEVHLAGGRIEREVPRQGLVPDLVPFRRPPR
jgi:hypothetical protein